jgi:hypothetical protein
MQDGFATPITAADTLLADDGHEDAATALLGEEAIDGSAAELALLLDQFKRRLDDPLLALPDPTVVRRRLFSVSKPTVRRSKRIAAKGKGVAVVKRAQRIVMHKLGICREGDKLSETQLKEYTAIFASPLGPEQIEVISSLFGLTCATTAGTEMVDGVDA